MTLNTKVWLHGPIDGLDAFSLAVKAIMEAGGRGNEAVTRIEHQPAGAVPEWAREASKDWDDYRLSLFVNDYDVVQTEPAQGLPAWVDCYYRADGAPLATEDVWDDYDEPYLVRPACQVQFSWDTAYGYRVNGESCTELHARALVLLQEFLPEGVTLSWENEYTGEVHEGVTTEALEEFLGTGVSSYDWFMGVAMPAVLEEVVSHA